MDRFEMTGERAVALFLLAVLLFNPPLLAIFDVPATVLGVPLSYLYLFTAWMVVIVLVALHAESVDLGAGDGDRPTRRGSGT